jgi:serine/threonine protein phosphatase PrpC
MTPAEAGVSAMRSVITRAIGVDIDVQPDLYDVPIQSGDALLLVSDGLTRHLSSADLEEVLSSTDNAEQACTSLVEYANQRGGSDNITCIVIRIGE